jgi:hypothetical protein
MDPTVGRNRRSRWTDALLSVCGAFVLTVFLMLATAFNPHAGLLARFFDLHGIALLAVEVGAILVVAVIVLVVERRESRRRIREREAALLESDPLGSDSLQSKPLSAPPLDQP